MLQSSIPSSGKAIPLSAWKVVPILSSIATMVMYAETMLVPAIPDLIKDFNIPYSTSSSILITYLITGAVMTPIAVLIIGFSMFIVFQTIPILVENPRPVGFGDPISAANVQLPILQYNHTSTRYVDL